MVVSIERIIIAIMVEEVEVRVGGGGGALQKQRH